MTLLRAAVALLWAWSRAERRRGRRGGADATRRLRRATRGRGGAADRARGRARRRWPPLAVLAGLDEKVAPRALEAAVRGGLARGRAPAGRGAGGAAATRASLDQRGDAPAAAAGATALGLCRAVLGDRTVRGGPGELRTGFPPEQERAPPELGTPAIRARSATSPGAPATGAVRDGALHLDGLLRPDTQAVAYAVTFVRSDRERPAALRLGSPGPIKVWVNGAGARHATSSVPRPWIRTPSACGSGGGGIAS